MNNECMDNRYILFINGTVMTLTYIYTSCHISFITHSILMPGFGTQCITSTSPHQSEADFYVFFNYFFMIHLKKMWESTEIPMNKPLFERCSMIFQ